MICAFVGVSNAALSSHTETREFGMLCSLILAACDILTLLGLGKGARAHTQLSVGLPAPRAGCLLRLIIIYFVVENDFLKALPYSLGAAFLSPFTPLLGQQVQLLILSLTCIYVCLPRCNPSALILIEK